MSEQTLPELVTSKRPDDVHGDRWTVTGVHGRITYRELGGAVMVVAAGGDRDHAVGDWPARCAAAAETGDAAVYAVLAELYAANFGGAR